MRKFAPIKNHETGIPFTVRLVEKGDRYGLRNCLVHNEDEPLVEFYDARYPFCSDPEGNVLGQFVSRYNLTILTGEHEFSSGGIAGRGINLHGGEPNWQIDAKGADEAMAFVNGLVAAKEGA